MLNYLKKFAMEIVPSVVATILGAYIVNHYINAKPATETPAALSSTAQPKSDPTKAEAKANPDAGIPASGIKAKGVSEKALLEKNAAAEKAVVVEKPQEKPSEKSQDKATDKPAEVTASIPADTKRPAPVRAAKAPSALQPVIAAAPADAAAAVEDRRDANDLARAAIERLRGNGEASKRPQEAPRAPEVARVPDAPRLPAAPPSTVSALPPPIVVTAPPEIAEPKAPYNAAARVEDPLRPTPPAEIPTARPPLDLRAEATAEPPKQRTNIGEDMLSAAKSMFHAVLPKPRQTAE
jgi:hypothetical protein